MSIKGWVVSLCILVLAGCSESTESEGQKYGPNGTHRSIGVVAPKHYDVWVDKFFIESLSKDIGLLGQTVWGNGGLANHARGLFNSLVLVRGAAIL